MAPNRHISNSLPALRVGDIYYILFRQKRRILTCAAAGVLAAAALFAVWHPRYQSEAKLLVRYVLESKLSDPAVNRSQVRSPDEEGRYIINTEIEILRSFDLAQQVVDTLGTEKILPGVHGDGAREMAAAVVTKDLTVDVPTMSSVIRVVFQHPNQEVVQPVLRELIGKYLKKHVDIHQGGGLDDLSTRQLKNLQFQFAQTEQELYTNQISKIQRELFDSQAELAERQAALKDMPETAPAVLNASQSNPAAVYMSLLMRLDQLWKKRQEFLTQFTEESVFLKEVNQAIAQVEAAREKLEAENPRLMSLQGTLLLTAASPSELLVEPGTISARVAALESRIQMLKSQLDRLRAEAVRTAADETAFERQQRKKQLDEANNRLSSASLEQSDFEEALEDGKESDISVIQLPSPPEKVGTKIYKLMADLSLAGLCIGLALAFFVELKLDQSVRRPADVQTILRLPLYLSIPRIGKNGHPRLDEGPHGAPVLAKNWDGAALAAAGNGSVNDGQTQVTIWNRGPALHNYYEALRDRLIVDFEVRDLKHKPKLLAVTSCSRGAGVTTVACGLAACLSQTGDGKVLLVDMTQQNAATQQFYNGKSVYGLDEALSDTNPTQVQDNLFVVTERTDNDSRSRNVARQFGHLMPKLKASSYDYIIFDMPPVSQTSITPRLAGFMDTVVLVIESEKTDRGLALHASAVLGESKANVRVVLNKTQTYVPSRLHQEFLSES